MRPSPAFERTRCHGASTRRTAAQRAVQLRRLSSQIGVVDEERFAPDFVFLNLASSVRRYRYRGRILRRS